jgi:prepilin-type N-terminal cleavage/methylation domain-containing protein
MNKKRIILPQRAFSMVEVVVAAVLFAVASAGIFATISLTNRTAESGLRVQAATFAKEVLDQLNSAVDASTWKDPNNRLSPGIHNVPLGSVPDFPACSATYEVSQPDGQNGARKVEIRADCP